MQIRKIDIDTVAFGDVPGPDYGLVAVEIGGRKMTFRLDQAQTDRLAKLGAEIAAEIHAEIASAERVAA